MKIKFGTDGWRAIIAQDFTVANVSRVAKATASWIIKNYPQPSIVIGHDCRFGGEMFAETTAKVMVAEGIKVYLAKGFVSTPMVSLGIVKLNASAGVIITASHNPPSYNGYKLKGHFGGPAFPSMIDEVEALIPETFAVPGLKMEELVKSGKIEIVDLETIYCDQLAERFDLEAIYGSKLVLAYDAMYGAGQNVIPRMFPDAVTLHCDENPGFHGQAPEPIHKNLHEFSEMIRISEDIDCGLVTDGDADRIGLYNGKGKFIDSHHIILLLIHYLHKHKALSGKVVFSFSCSRKIQKLCDIYGLPWATTKIGFKYICEHMVNEDVLVGGEESGGIAIKGHIPERDGIWIGVVLWEFMAKSGKSLDKLISEVYDIVGKFAMERNDLQIEEQKKLAIVQNCKDNKYRSFGTYKVEKVEDLDGYKFHLGNDEWVMIRASGTEPVLRIYAEAETSEKAFAIIKATQDTVMA
jgi:phosphomannomutase